MMSLAPRSLDGVKRNPGAPDYAKLHPGYRRLYFHKSLALEMTGNYAIWALPDDFTFAHA